MRTNTVCEVPDHLRLPAFSSFVFFLGMPPETLLMAKSALVAKRSSFRLQCVKISGLLPRNGIFRVPHLASHEILAPHPLRNMKIIASHYG